MANKNISNLINDSSSEINNLLKDSVAPIKDPLSLSSTKSSFQSDGFTVPPTYAADGNGLPSSKTSTDRTGNFKRNIITWLVPDFGLVKMYINPQQISYRNKKLVQKERTKGGYTIQYWGEELGELSITGTTGSSGIEGINVLEEIYRAEQLGFDGTGLVLAANNAASQISNELNGSIVGSLVGGALGLNSPVNNLSSRNIPTLAQAAFSVEMYYDGWVYRGYFLNFNVEEKANDFNWTYSMDFVVTQRRGYRVNYFPWTLSAKDGPSQYTTPATFAGNRY